MTIIAFPSRASCAQAPDKPSTPLSYEEMMILRHCLGRPWLDMLSHDDQARIARDYKTILEPVAALR